MRLSSEAAAGQKKGLDGAVGDDNVFGRTAGYGGGGGAQTLGSHPGAVIQRHVEIGLDVVRRSETQKLAGGEPRCSAAGEVEPGWPAASGEPAFELGVLHTGDAAQRATLRARHQRGGVDAARFTLADHMRRHPPQECLRPNHSLKIWGALGVVRERRPTILLVAKARILVVDDDPTVVEVLTRYLDNEGFEVRSAADGNAALEAATQDPPDLVVLDLMLPEMHGLDVFRRIRLMGRVPVIMLTALGEEEDRVGGLEVGADDYVTKPFSPARSSPASSRF